MRQLLAAYRHVSMNFHDVKPDSFKLAVPPYHGKRLLYHFQICQKLFHEMMPGEQERQRLCSIAVRNALKISFACIKNYAMQIQKGQQYVIYYIIIYYIYQIIYYQLFILISKRPGTLFACFYCLHCFTINRSSVLFIKTGFLPLQFTVLKFNSCAFVLVALIQIFFQFCCILTEMGESCRTVHSKDEGSLQTKRDCVEFIPLGGTRYKRTYYHFVQPSKER